jgi:hypothetical protein
MSPGTGLAFMLAGGATSVPALLAVWPLVKPRAFALHLAYAVIGALLAGYAYAAILASMAWVLVDGSISLELAALLFACALGIGCLDAISGGGGLLTVPLLLALGFPPTQALATMLLGILRVIVTEASATTGGDATAWASSR